MSKIEIRHFHLFCGLGGGAAGFNRGEARVGSVSAKSRCIGGIDVDAAGIRDFNTLSGVHGTVLDMFDIEQYRAFHGMEPPPGWSEATPVDIQRAAGNERPHIVFLSAPCKGFSGLLSESKSKLDKYQALNRLTLRGVFLMLEAWQLRRDEYWPESDTTKQYIWGDRIADHGMSFKVGKKAAGRLLDGVLHDEFPIARTK